MGLFTILLSHFCCHWRFHPSATPIRVPVPELGAVRAALRDSVLRGCCSSARVAISPQPWKSFLIWKGFLCALHRIPKACYGNEKLTRAQFCVFWTGTAQGTGRNSSSFLGSWHRAGAGGGISSLDHHFALSAMTKIQEASRAPKLRQQS